MNKDFLIIGARVLAAVAIGVTIFLCTGKVENPSSQQGNQNRKKDDDNLGRKDDLNTSGGSSSNFWNPEVQPEVKENAVNSGSHNQQPQHVDQKSNGEKIIFGLRGINMAIGRMSQVINSLTDITRSIMRLFGKDGGPRQQYGSNPWSCGQIPINRVNPYIIQVGPTYDNNYGYYGQQYSEY